LAIAFVIGKICRGDAMRRVSSEGRTAYLFDGIYAKQQMNSNLTIGGSLLPAKHFCDFGRREMPKAEG
jgi:hypothetical protein